MTKSDYPVRTIEAEASRASFLLDWTLFVEGKKDWCVYCKFYSEEKVVVKGTKGDVVNIVDELQNNAKVVGIIDADFDRIYKTTYSENIFMTDYHDLEIMILLSDVLENMIIPYKCSEKNLQKLRDKLAEIGLHVARLRYHFGKELKPKLGIALPVIPWGTIVNRADCSVDLDKLCEILATKIKSELECSNNPQESSERVTKKEIKDLSELPFEVDEKVWKWDICRGHDLTQVLALWCEVKLKQNDIERVMYASYRIEDFKKTDLYRSIQEWAEKNKFGVFKD